MTITAAARRHVRTPSNEARRLLDDLIGAPLEARRGFMRTLTPADWVQVLHISTREEGTPYLLWRDDPVGFVQNVLRENTWSRPREILSTIPKIQKVAVPSCYASGKCVYRKEMLMLADGSVVKAEDLIGRSFEMLGWAEDGTQTVRRAHASWNAIEPVFRITTDSGRTVVRNGAHPFWTATAQRLVHPKNADGSYTSGTIPQVRGWTPLENITEGDLILVPEVVHPTLTERMPFEQAALLGYLLGDGHTVREVRFSHLPGETLDEFIACVEALGGQIKDYPVKEGRKHRELVVRGFGERRGEGAARMNVVNPVWDLVKEWGLAGKRATEKRLPDFVWRLHLDDLAVILSRLFACDGWASHGKNKQFPKGSSVGISLANEGLIRDVQRAMLRFGINGRIYRKNVKSGGKVYPYWEWAVTHARDLQRFADTFHVPGKQETIEMAAEVAATRKHKLLWPHRNAPEGYRWEKVKSIEPMGEQATVAIEVDVDHTWVDLFVEHNTWSASRACLWFAFTHAPGTAKVITMAPTWRQVVRLLWSEVRAAHARAGLPGEVDMAQLKIPGVNGVPEVVAYGLSAAPWNEAAVQGVHCFDAETELLTDEGWKPFPEVRGDERVLTLNGDTAEWGPITKVWRHPFKGELNLHDGARVNFCVTDNHRFLVRSSVKDYKRHGQFTAEQAQTIKDQRVAGVPVEALAKQYNVSTSLIYKIVQGKRDHSFGHRTDGPRWRLIEYKDLPGSFIVRRTNTWKGESPDTMILEVPQRPYRKAERYEFDFGDWCEFLGWFVAEGSTSQQDHGCVRVAVSQKPGPKFDRIAALLTRMGIRWSPASHDLRFSSDAIGLWLREHCGVGSHNKRIPRMVKEARPEHMERFLSAYADGDGHAHNDAGGRRYVTASVQLRDDLHEMLCKLGRGRKYMAHHAEGSEGAAPKADGTLRSFTRKADTWHIHDAGVPTDSDILKSNVVKMPYDGIVYCVSTPHETIMVRRKGCSMWSGNSPNLLLIVDEAGGISHVIGRNLRGMTSTEGSHMLAIGNPPTDDEGSWFEGLCTRTEESASVIPISAFDTPSLSGEKAPVCRTCSGGLTHRVTKHLVTPDWVRETIDEHGDDSNYVQAKVYARFPRGGPSRVLPSSWVDMAAESDEPETEEYVRLCDLGLADERDQWKVAMGSWVRLGVDVAADGGDEFVIARSVGDLAQIQHFSSGAANTHGMTVAGIVLREIRKAEALSHALGSTSQIHVKIDVIGVGWNVADVLRAWGSEELHTAKIVPVVASESTDREPDGATLRPYKKRDEMWLAMRSRLQPRGAEGELGPGIRLRLDRQTLAQLRAPTVAYNSQGLAVVESKKNLKGRGLSSPDRAEAVLMSIYEPFAKPKRKRAKLIAA